eukprot:8439010-Karenia_brevis.AAC.1
MQSLTTCKDAGVTTTPGQSSSPPHSSYRYPAATWRTHLRSIYNFMQQKDVSTWPQQTMQRWKTLANDFGTIDISLTTYTAVQSYCRRHLTMVPYRERAGKQMINDL